MGIYTTAQSRHRKATACDSLLGTLMELKMRMTLVHPISHFSDVGTASLYEPKDAMDPRWPGAPITGLHAKPQTTKRMIGGAGEFSRIVWSSTVYRHASDIFYRLDSPLMGQEHQWQIYANSYFRARDQLCL